MLVAHRLFPTPVMVCMDGFILTHAFEAVDVPEQDEVSHARR